jgi:hypothetical protein
MNLIYKNFFSIKVAHTYYNDTVSRDDLQFIPTRECRDLLDRSRMLFRKNVDGGISILYKATSENVATPFIAFDPNTYVFAIAAKEKARFVNITDLDDGSTAYEAGKFIYIKNNNTAQELEYELLDALRAAVFGYEFSFTSPASASPATGEFIVYDENDVEVYRISEIPRDASGKYNASVDMRSLPPGKYKLACADALNTKVLETSYIDSGLAGKGVMGVVSISDIGIVRNTFLALPSFTISFDRQETLWRYYIVLKSGKVLSTDTLEIVDLAYDDTNSSYAEYTFTPEGLQDLGGNVKAFSFLSDQLIPFFEEPKLDLKLRKTTSGVTTLISSLPNPAASGTIGDIVDTGNIPVSEIYVYV